MTKIRIQDKNPYDFSIKETLHPDLWEDDALKQEVIEMLLKIADDFIEGLDIDGIEVEDISSQGLSLTLTGLLTAILTFTC